MSNVTSIQSGRHLQLEKLLQGCAAGDSKAFEDLYTATSPQLFAIVLRILKSKAAAEEVIQDTYLKIWQRASDYLPEIAKPMTWMVSIARNRAVDVLRKGGREFSAEDLQIPEPVADDPGPARETSLGQDMQTLQDCMDKLSNEQHDTISLAYLEGLTYPQIAKRLAAPLNTIKSWVRRGTVALKKCMEL